MSMPAFEESSRVRRSRRTPKKIFDLSSARRTLPLVGHIVAEAVEVRTRWIHNRREADKLQALRTSDWNVRKDIYRLGDEIKRDEARHEALEQELFDLGVVLMDDIRGLAGFPTIVNGSLAYLVFQHELEDIRSWRYRDQEKLRPIPQEWDAETPLLFENSEGLLV
ncbi:hypothetical protein Pan216_19790 [Planctomycetes bacterium Pan216]|uniref:DUF2203 family protein n=1 Tax=Kolteria novifilia TaxID=2527975 RepID=A0A518B2C1_9BACT|nr:hypothetical protein Pan216_19790 [Planctomycetes bacterium Pan216]